MALPPEIYLYQSPTDAWNDDEQCTASTSASEVQICSDAYSILQCGAIYMDMDTQYFSVSRLRFRSFLIWHDRDLYFPIWEIIS